MCFCAEQMVPPEELCCGRRLMRWRRLASLGEHLVR